MTLRLVAVWLLLLAAAAADAAPGHLRTEQIVVETRDGVHRFTVEIAADRTSRDRGLMRRKHMAPDAGMLFDFRQPMMVAFWMKDTVIPLDMLFVRADGTISSIAANAVPYSEAEIQSLEPVRAVVEINGGRAAALGIRPGDLVRAAAFANQPVRPPARHRPAAH